MTNARLRTYFKIERLWGLSRKNNLQVSKTRRDVSKNRELRRLSSSINYDGSTYRSECHSRSMGADRGGGVGSKQIVVHEIQKLVMEC